MSSSHVARHLDEVRQRIAKATADASRDASSVTLLAVSKTFPAEDVRAAFNAGQRAFGENYVQEAVAKITGLADLRSEIEWHFIGPLQSNKTKVVAENFDWVHSVDRLKIAERLAHQIAVLPRLHLRGLMAIPEPAGTLDEQRAPHRRLREIMDTLRSDGLELDTLSMGMSADIEAAILEGATMVRIGTAIFGARDYSH
jgi:uncharacterized pyridoxal phosphate-containing UPF0001 family protein